MLFLRCSLAFLGFLGLFSCASLPPQSDPLSEDDFQPESAIRDDYFGMIRGAVPDLQTSLSGPPDWYLHPSYYQVWIKSFRDASQGPLSGDGVGDLVGLREAVEEGWFEKLGVGTLWLSPFFACAGESDPKANMHGYDTVDFYRLNRHFGTKEDLKALLTAAHSRGLRVLFDFAPNQLHKDHPWFKASSDPAHPQHEYYRNWFLWRKDKPLNAKNWTGSSTWYLDENRGEYFYGVYNQILPDLNYHHPQVRAAMANVLLYWLNFGFDGTRVDSVKYIFEKEGTPFIYENHPETFRFFTEMRDLLDLYQPSGYNKVMLAENWQTNLSLLESYVRQGSREGFQMTFDFAFSDAVYGAIRYGHGGKLVKHYGEEQPAGVAYTRFLTNHDNVNSRPMSEFNSTRAARLAAALNILGPGPYFVYYGNEIGMAGAKGSDADLRRGFDWKEALVQGDDPQSLLTWYRSLGSLRRDYSGLFADPANLRLLSRKDQKSFLALEWQNKDQRILAVFNFLLEPADLQITIPVDGANNPAVGTLVGSGGLPVWSSGGTLSIPAVPAQGVRVYKLGGSPVPAYAGDNLTDAPLPPLLRTAVYLRGDVGIATWDTGLGFTALGDNQFVLTRDLPGGTYEFKFTEDQKSWGMEWTGANLKYDGQRGASVVYRTEPEDHYNLLIDLTPGRWTMHLDLNRMLFWVSKD